MLCPYYKISEKNYFFYVTIKPRRIVIIEQNEHNTKLPHMGRTAPSVGHTEQRKVNLIIDIQTRIRAGKDPAYEGK